MVPSVNQISDFNIPKIVMPTMPRAIVLSNGDLSSNDRNVGALLDFFGVSWEIATISQIAACEGPSQNRDCDRYCLLGSAAVMAEAFQVFGESQGTWSRLAEKATSVCIYGFQESDSCKKLLKLLTSDRNANIRQLDSTATVISVTSDFPEMCGPISGLRVPVTPTNVDQAFDVHGEGEVFHRIISTTDGDIFANVTYRGVQFFLSACRDTIDIDTPSRKPFDVKKCFCSAVPITMYLKWALADACWKSAETRACLIVDDPLLKPRYGFLRFKRVLELMDEHDFTMSLAFIPWNGRRTDPEVVDLFQRRADRFSLSIHGCDHTASEFAAHSLTQLNAKAKVASERMARLYQRTSLTHDRIMVFPQGEFSAETGRVLKLNGFIAAVNTEVTPSDGLGSDTTIADLWDVAINKYGSFPIFTRRYLTHGVENFAFDILLGKPCLIVAHHQEFKDDGRDLIELIDRINSLPCQLVWGSLGDVISRSYRTRCEPEGKSIVQMYGNCACVENPTMESRTTEFIKKESDPDCVGAVMVNQKSVGWSCESGDLRFRITIPPKQTAEVSVVYSDKLGQSSYPEDVRYTFKTALRRYLSETRDQYFSRSTVLSKTAAWMRELLK
jgi:hypothetical protein